MVLLSFTKGKGDKCMFMFVSACLKHASKITTSIFVAKTYDLDLDNNSP